MQQLQTLRSYLHIQVGHAGDVATGFVEAGDKSDRNRVDCCRENDWDGRSRRLGRHCRRGAATRYNHIHLTVNQFSRKCRKSIVLVFCPAIFDRDVLALDIPCLFQPLPESAQADRVFVRGCTAKKPNHWQRRLLRPHCERPSDC